jgi:hypothetical protein
MESVLHQRRKTSFIDDAREFNLGWRMWMLLLTAVNLVAPLFFLSRPEAWAALGSYALAAAVMIPLHRRLGWVRLLGVGHFPWLVVLPWLLARIMGGDLSGGLYIWVWALLLIDTVCLGIDVVDVARYVMGDRSPIVPLRR